MASQEVIRASQVAGQNTFTFLRQLGTVDLEAVELAVIVARAYRAVN